MRRTENDPVEMLHGIPNRAMKAPLAPSGPTIGTAYRE